MAGITIPANPETLALRPQSGTECSELSLMEGEPALARSTLGNLPETIVVQAKLPDQV
jgi:hypothetical protein